MRLLPWPLVGLSEFVVDKAIVAEPSSDKEVQQPRKSGAWTVICLWLSLLVLAVLTDGFGALWKVVGDLFAFDLAAMRAVDNSLVNLLPILAALLVVRMPLAYALLWLVNLRYGKPKKHKVQEVFSGAKPHYMLMTVVVVVEELFARGLFLGVPWVIWGDSIPVAAYVALFLIGNSLWAVMHLGNFAEKEDRRLGRVLPQFVGGIFLTLVFVQFGLLGSIVVHLAFNYLLMSGDRKGIFNKGEVLVIAWHSFVALVSGVLLMGYTHKSLGDLGAWFDHNAQSFAVPGWQFQHYALAAIFIGSVLTVFAELLLLDLHPTEIEAAGLDGVGRAILLTTLAFVTFYGLQLFNAPLDIRVFVMALVFLLVRRSASGSGMARIFWIALPMLMFQLCAILALGWNSAAWLIGLALAFIDLPDRWLRVQDAKREAMAAARLASVAEPIKL